MSTKLQYFSVLANVLSRMNRFASFSSSFNKICLTKCWTRHLSAQAALSLKPTDEEYLNAKPFAEIPGVSKFELIKRFMAGGKFHNKSMIDIQIMMRKEFGDLYCLPGMFGQSTMVTTFDPIDIEFMHRNEGTYPFRRSMQTMEYFRKNIRSDVYSVGGLVVEQGEVWHKMRSAVNPVLMQPKLVKSYIPTIDGIVNEFFKNIPLIQDEKDEMPADFYQYINRWSLESIVAIALEKRLGLMDFSKNDGIGLKITKAVRTIIDLGMEFEMKPTIWRIYQTKKFKTLMSAYNELTDYSLQIIDEAKKRFEKSTDQDTSVLFKLMQKDKRFAIVMAFDMIFAGIDTTASALSFITYCLAKNPDKQEKLRQELKQVMPEQNTPLTGETMANMPYLRAVIKETLRMYPPAMGNMRRTAENLVIKGYQVPPGVDVFFGLMHIYLDKDYFASPNEFVPERWLRDQEAESCPHLKATNPFAYLPFGFGARFCVGKRIAEMELEVFVSRLIRNYQVEWHYPDIKIKATMINKPENELKFKFVKI